MKLQLMVGKIKLGAKRNAPELLLGLGLFTGTLCLVTTGRATIKAKELNDIINSIDLEQMNECLTEEEHKKMVKKLYTKHALDLAKTYALPVGLYAITVASIFSSYKIQKNRQLALSAALSACTAAYSTLVGKLKAGAAAGLTAQQVMDGVEGKINPETGEMTMEQGVPVDGLYTARFDEYSTSWEKDRFQNECTLRSEESWANNMLRLRGYVFLNEIYDRLGLTPTKAGQIVGWTTDGVGDGYVDFNTKDAAEYEDVRFDRNAFDLEFNVDGDILNKLK